jgi:hypothetical protein
MTELSLRRYTGIFGLVATLISLTDIPLYFMYTGAPPQWDILTRVLVGIVSSTILIVFLVGFRLVICQAWWPNPWRLELPLCLKFRLTRLWMASSPRVNSSCGSH